MSDMRHPQAVLIDVISEHLRRVDDLDMSEPDDDAKVECSKRRFIREVRNLNDEESDE